MAVRRSTSVSGASAREHAIAACRRLFDIAIADGHLQHNPAKAARKPQRQESRRTALTDEQVAEVFGVVRDAETRLLTFLLETACRRGPARPHTRRAAPGPSNGAARREGRPCARATRFPGDDGVLATALVPNLLVDPAQAGLPLAAGCAETFPGPARSV